MPDFGSELKLRISNAVKLAEIGEIARLEAAIGSKTRAALYPARLEALYEMAYLRVFVSWESFVEQVFLRYLCGYNSKHGTATPIPGGKFESTIAKAEQAVLGKHAYALWHNPTVIVQRCQKFFGTCVVEAVVQSNSARLQSFAAIRHRIAHDQSDARTKFDAATMSLAGKRYIGSRPGTFLRDWDKSATPPVRWIDTLTNELDGLAKQVA